MNEEVRYITVNGKYSIEIERAASSTKGVLGFKVKANGDDIALVKIDIAILKDRAEQVAGWPEASAPVVPVTGKAPDATKGE